MRVEAIAFVIGVVLMVVGLAVSIALHELGHLVPAKMFGVPFDRSPSSTSSTSTST